jgi:hypothetical protein
MEYFPETQAKAIIHEAAHFRLGVGHAGGRVLRQ